MSFMWNASIPFVFEFDMWVMTYEENYTRAIQLIIQLGYFLENNMYVFYV